MTDAEIDRWLADAAKRSVIKRCTVCALGPEALEWIVRVLARMDETGTRVPMQVVYQELVRRWKLQAKSGSLHNHVRGCLGRRGWRDGGEAASAKRKR